MTRYFDLGRPRRRPRPAPKEEQIFHEPPIRVPEPKRPGRGRRSETGFYYLGLVALLLFLVALYTSSGSTPPAPVPTPALQTNKDQLPRLLTPTVLNTPSPTPAPPSAASATPDNEKTKILMRVLNGSRKPERLITATDTLAKAGFKVDSTGNAVNFYQTTVIYYKAGKLQEAQLVQTAAKEVLQSTLQQSSIVGNNDVLVVVGVK